MPAERVKKPKSPSAVSGKSPRVAALGNKAADAYARVEPKLAALAESDLATFNVDPRATAERVLGAMPGIYAQRSAIVTELPKHPIADLDHLEELALALWYAQLLHEHATSGGAGAGSDVKAHFEEGSTLRETLLVAAEALAHKGHFDKEAVAQIRRGHVSHSEVASDLVALAELWGSAWSKVSTKTAVEKKEVERAASLGPELMMSGSLKKHADGHPGHASGDVRARVFTLLAKAYDSVRRAVTYVRWQEGDADEIVPTLYPRTRKSKSSVIEPANGASAASDTTATSEQPAAEA